MRGCGAVKKLPSPVTRLKKGLNKQVSDQPADGQIPLSPAAAPAQTEREKTEGVLSGADLPTIDVQDAREQQVMRMIAPALRDLGYDLVRVKIMGSKERPTLQIMAEPVAAEDGTRRPMGVEDCTIVSRNLSALLDVEDPITSAYVLEVSSPGIDRPLTRPVDFHRFAGFDAKLELITAVDGRRRFRGRLLEMTDGLIRMHVEGQDIEVPLDSVRRAKLVLSDELLAAIESGDI